MKPFSMKRNTELITILEKGCIYKFKYYYQKKYAYFCPSRKRNLDNLTRWGNYGTALTTIFNITSTGEFMKSSHVYVTRGYVKRITFSDYIKLNNILKKNGYTYNKMTKKLIKYDIKSK